MGDDSYKKAIELIEANKNLCDFFGPRSDAVIENAEKILGLNFSKLFRHFIKNYGAGAFGFQEIYGVTKNEFVRSAIPNGVWVTLKLRKEANLPNDKFVMYFTGSEEYYCLDFSKIIIDNEPAIVIFVPGAEEAFQKFEVIYNDFGDFLLDKIKNVLL
jgi:antitoxin YobK